VNIPLADKLLKIKDLNVIYQTDQEKVFAVNSIGFTIGNQETLGLVGETGAGKTTTALSIMQLLPERIGKIKSGEILLDDINLLTIGEKQMRNIRGSRIAMIFQDPMTSLNPVIMVGDQIREALELHNIENHSNAQLDERVDEMLEMVGIHPGRKNSYPHEFSGGMKQRVVIAMALACDPELLIADEPTTALDVTIQAQVLKMISDLKKKLGTSMLLITHDLGVVAQTCDKVAIMYAGQIIEHGTVEDIFWGEKHHPYTTGLFGSIPNMMEKSLRLKPISGLMPDPTNLPAGCKFHPRCDRCMDVCQTKAPPVYTSDTHQICCHMFVGDSEGEVRL